MNVRAIREEMGMTQVRLAHALKDTPTHISDLERGARGVSRGMRARLTLIRIMYLLKDSDKPVATQIKALAEDGL